MRTTAICISPIRSSGNARAMQRSLRRKPFAAICRISGSDVSELVVSGTPTFAINASHPGRELSPGTCVLWDAGYASICPDLDFLWAATVMTRVVSQPAADCICLDLGHKAVAADPKGTRAVFPPDLPDAEVVVHSEEHLTLRTARASECRIGDVFYGIPWHICPTCRTARSRDRRLEEVWRKRSMASRCTDQK